MIAGAHAGHTRAYFAHYSRALMSQHERRPCGPVAARRVQVALTNSGGLHFDQYLARARRFEFGFLNRERFSLFPQDRCVDFHTILRFLKD
jgi:hypothetical protein